MYKQNVKNQREEKSASPKKEPTFFLYNVACRIKLRFRDFIRIVARTDNLELSDGASGLPFPISWTKETIVAEKVGSSLVSRATGWFPVCYTAEKEKYRLRVRVRPPDAGCLSTAPPSVSLPFDVSKNGSPESFSRHVHLWVSKEEGVGKAVHLDTMKLGSHFT